MYNKCSVNFRTCRTFDYMVKNNFIEHVGNAKEHNYLRCIVTIFI